MKPFQWQFSTADVTRRKQWYWKHIDTVADIEERSSAFMDYGAAVADAIRHGFLPSRDNWVVHTPTGTTEYVIGLPPKEYRAVAESPSRERPKSTQPADRARVAVSGRPPAGTSLPRR